MNGWIVHTIRSIMADKRHKPEFNKAVFPFDKVYKQFFAEGRSASKKKPVSVPLDGKPRTVGEVAHMAQVIRRRYEQAVADYKAGKIVNRFGLYVHEQVKG